MTWAVVTRFVAPPQAGYINYRLCDVAWSATVRRERDPSLPHHRHSAAQGLGPARPDSARLDAPRLGTASAPAAAAMGNVRLPTK